VNDTTPTTNPTPGQPPVDDPSEPSQGPGERRLAHPPSDRYRAATAATPPAETVDPGASIPRGIAIASVAAILGAVALVVLGGVLSQTSGLLIVAGATGWGAGAGLRFGAGDRLAPSRRWATAVILSLAAVALAQLGLWQYARSEGGVLPPLDYLGEVFGPLVPLELATAGVVAWLMAR
jgi:hypothetical protein